MLLGEARFTFIFIYLSICLVWILLCTAPKDPTTKPMGSFRLSWLEPLPLLPLFSSRIWISRPGTSPRQRGQSESEKSLVHSWTPFKLNTTDRNLHRSLQSQTNAFWQVISFVKKNSSSLGTQDLAKSLMVSPESRFCLLILSPNPRIHPGLGATGARC